MSTCFNELHIILRDVILDNPVTSVQCVHLHVPLFYYFLSFMFHIYTDVFDTHHVDLCNTCPGMRCLCVYMHGYLLFV
jgi:hypothetical protein